MLYFLCDAYNVNSKRTKKIITHFKVSVFFYFCKLRTLGKTNKYFFICDVAVSLL